MISITDNKGRTGVQTQATLVNIADTQYLQTSSGGGEYLPSTIQFDDAKGITRQASCMLYVKQYPEAKVGDVITVNAFPGDERGPVIMSALSGRIKNNESWFDFEGAKAEQRVAPAV